jgi:hypothetical protein
MHFASAVLTLCIALSGIAQAQTKTPMTQQAKGPFDVKIAPQKPDSDVAQAANFSRMTIDKVFHGDLEGTSKGEMIATQAETKSSGGYVALERVTGTLKGREGSFILQHSATMNRGVPSLSITVVPDSGTDELAGITGKLNIVIAKGGKHSYDFEYSLP